MERSLLSVVNRTIGGDPEAMMDQIHVPIRAFLDTLATWGAWR